MPQLTYKSPEATSESKCASQTSSDGAVTLQAAYPDEKQMANLIRQEVTETAHDESDITFEVKNKR